MALTSLFPLLFVGVTGALAVALKRAHSNTRRLIEAYALAVVLCVAAQGWTSTATARHAALLVLAYSLVRLARLSAREPTPAASSTFCPGEPLAPVAAYAACAFVAPVGATALLAGSGALQLLLMLLPTLYSRFVTVLVALGALWLQSLQLS